MRYIIKEFEFDSTSLVLSQNGEALTIRHNEAKLLALLIENSQQVFSKEDILSQVWQGKIVSEQAVFQNISHLRSIFGAEAIKTFPKRGYQWLLAVEALPEPVPEKQSITTVIPNTAPEESKSTKHNYWRYVAFASLIMAFLAAFVWHNSWQKQSASAKLPIAIAYIPFVSSDNASSITFQNINNIGFTELTEPSYHLFNTSIELEYPKIANEHPYILTGQIRQFNEKTYVDFHLKGKFEDWQGQLSAPSQQEAIKALQHHLTQPFIYAMLSEKTSAEIKQANLSIAHQQRPNDLINLGNLVDAYINTGEFDKAMVLADKLESSAKQQNSLLQLGNAQLLQSGILTRKELFDLSAHKLAQAITNFEQINDIKKQADAWFAQSWLKHQEDDYIGIKDSLLTSAELANKVQDIPRELDALTYLSVMAHKHKQHQDKYQLLQQAENKMTAYKLPIYHFAKIPFHHAIYTKNPSAKEPHLKQVLIYTELTPEHWVAQSSREQLVKHFIKQDRLLEAEAIVNKLKPDNASNTYLKMLVAQANKDTEAFVKHAQRTFEFAHFSGETKLSLDTALLLCSTPNQPVNYDFYTQYISDNATAGWRRQNEVKLVALNL